MQRRLIQVLLVIAVAWSGLVTHERARAQSSPQGQAQIQAALMAAPAPADCALDAQHPDELPAQAHVELQTDAQAVLPAPGAAPATTLTMARPVDGPATALAPPDLDGPQRPPRPALPGA